MADDNDATARLDQLGAELRERGVEAQLVAPQERPSWLAVRNPQALMMAEEVLEAGWFWWPWADRIAPAADMPAAVARVASVLAGGSDG